VIVTGLGIGTLFTVFVVPAFYLLLSPDTHRSVHVPNPGLEATRTA
jgi:multidrug efflux pump